MEALGIDIGGSNLKAAPVNLDSGILTSERIVVPTPHPATPDAVACAVERIVNDFSWTGRVGCGLPAVVRNGIACTAANIDKSWIGTDVATLFSERTGLTINVLNDADAAGLAEMQYGAGKDTSGTVIVVTAGTGLGTAIFRNRTLLPNTELGHLPLNGLEAEKVASAAVRTGLNLTYRDWAERFNAYLLLLEELFWPDLLIVGGEISRDHEKFFPYLTVKSRILPAALRNDAGIIGAATAAKA